jgi:hypothetical protein
MGIFGDRFTKIEEIEKRRSASTADLRFFAKKEARRGKMPVCAICGPHSKWQRGPKVLFHLLVLIYRKNDS